MMTGTCGWFFDAVRSTSMPSTPGMRKSVITTSTSASRSIASSPLAACTTSWPSRRNSAASTRRRFCSSSATRILAGCIRRLPYTIFGNGFGLVIRVGPAIGIELGDRGQPAGLGDVLDLVRRHRLGGGQKHRERRALAERGAHLDRAAVLVDDAMRDREAQARALGLRRVERDEQLLQAVARDADAGVAKANLAELAVAESRAPPACGQDLERAAVGHRLQCVLGEVEKNLQQRLGIAGDHRQLLVGAYAELDVLDRLLIEQLHGLADDLVEIDLVAVVGARPLGARVVEEPRHDVVQPVRLFDDDVEELGVLGARTRAIAGHEELRGAFDRAERVADLVRETGGHLAEGRQAIAFFDALVGLRRFDHARCADRELAK